MAQTVGYVDRGAELSCHPARFAAVSSCVFDAGSVPVWLFGLFKYYEERSRKYKDRALNRVRPRSPLLPGVSAPSPLWEEPPRTICPWKPLIPDRLAPRIAWLRKKVIQGRSISGKYDCAGRKCQKRAICCGCSRINFRCHQTISKDLQSLPIRTGGRPHRPFFCATIGNDSTMQATSITGYAEGKMGRRNGLYPGSRKRGGRFDAERGPTQSKPTSPQFQNVVPPTSRSIYEFRPIVLRPEFVVVRPCREGLLGALLTGPRSCSCFLRDWRSAVICGLRRFHCLAHSGGSAGGGAGQTVNIMTPRRN